MKVALSKVGTLSFVSLGGGPKRPFCRHWLDDLVRRKVTVIVATGGAHPCGQVSDDDHSNRPQRWVAIQLRTDTSQA